MVLVSMYTDSCDGFLCSSERLTPNTASTGKKSEGENRVDSFAPTVGNEKG